MLTLHSSKRDNNCVTPVVTLSVSVTGVISEWEGGAHEGSHVESNHVATAIVYCHTSGRESQPQPGWSFGQSNFSPVF